MRNYSNTGRGAVAIGLLASTAAIGLVGAAPATAAETCFINSDGFYACSDSSTGENDNFYEGTFKLGATGDGAYDNLDEKIEQTAPTQAEIDAAQTEVDAAQDNADTLAAAQTEVTGALTQDNLDAFADLETAQADLEAAQAAELAAADVVADANAVYTAAADDLTAANQAVTDANIAVSQANDDVAAAQAAYDADQSTANLAALNDALVVRAEAQQDLAAAEDARADALAAATGAADVLDAAQLAFSDAVDATIAAADGVTDAANALDTSLATNTDFVDAITAAGYSADATGLDTLTSDAAAAEVQLAAAQTQFDTLDDVTNTFIRARDVLVDAAENQNAAIAAASQALLGDPRAAETNSEVEVIAALVDHEDRISANEATLVDHDARITANAEAIVVEAETRAAADAALLERITSEENARIAADTALSNRIDAVDGRVDVLETRMDQFDDRIASSTATAIALGGMAFLPDMKFNLAVSGGFYEGANAIAANMGFRVSDNVAVTAGIGGGLNKQGKIAGRVGVIFGW